MLSAFPPLGHLRFGSAPLLRDCELASPVRGVAFRRRPRPVDADGRRVAVPKCVELVTSLDEEAERVDAVEILEDEEVDFGWEREERWHALATEIFWLRCYGIGSHCRTAGIDDELLDWGSSEAIGCVGGARVGSLEVGLGHRGGRGIE